MNVHQHGESQPFKQKIDIRLDGEVESQNWAANGLGNMVVNSKTLAQTKCAKTGSKPCTARKRLNCEKFRDGCPCKGGCR